MAERGEPPALALLTSLVERFAAILRTRTALLGADPLSESGHAAVVRLLVREGRNKEALAHYEHVSWKPSSACVLRPNGRGPANLRPTVLASVRERPARAWVPSSAKPPPLRLCRP